VADLDVVDEDVPLGEEDFPIVVAGADEGQGESAGISHVGADVEKIFEEPEGAKGGAGGFAFDEEIRKTGERGDEFGESAAENGHGVAEGAEQGMARFMDGEIGEIDDEEIGRVEGGVAEEESVEDDPGDAGGFGDGFPFAEVVGRKILGESGHEAKDSNGAKRREEVGRGEFPSE